MITKEEIASGYDKIAEKIYVSDTFYNEVMAIEKNWQGAVLDAGCGQGPVLQKLAKFLKENPKSQFPKFASSANSGATPVESQALGFQPKQIPNSKFQIQRLVGIDISDRLLEMARQKVPEAEIIKADIDKMPFPGNTFDFAVMVDVFQYLCQGHGIYDAQVRHFEASVRHSERSEESDNLSGLDTNRSFAATQDDDNSHICGFSRALKEIYRVLKPGGKFIVTVPNKNWLLFDSYIKRRKNIQPVEDHFFTFEEMADLLKNHSFKIEDYRGADCFRYYAPYHKYEMRLAMLFPRIHKKMKKIIFKAQKE